MKRTLSTVAVLVLCIHTIGAQGPAAQNPIAAGQKMLYSMIKNNIIRSAEKMPEENYGFRPTPEVRNFGQLIGHVADSQYLFCSAVLGKPSTRRSAASALAAIRRTIGSGRNHALAGSHRVHA